MTEFDEKVLDNFPGKVVRKDLTMLMKKEWLKNFLEDNNNDLHLHVLSFQILQFFLEMNLQEILTQKMPFA